LTWAGLWDGLGPTLSELPRILRDCVGNFAADTPVTPLAWIPWAALVVGVLLYALRLAPPGRRLRLAGLTVVALAAVVVAADVHRQSGEVKSRYILPFLMPVVFFAGALITEAGLRLSRAAQNRLVAVSVGTAAWVHFVAWWWAARRTAVGSDGPVWFAPHAEWSPPGGWLPWELVAIAGAGVFVLGAISALAARRQRAAAPLVGHREPVSP
jgi:hypothetical protein